MSSLEADWSLSALSSLSWFSSQKPNASMLLSLSLVSLGRAGLWFVAPATRESPRVSAGPRGEPGRLPGRMEAVCPGTVCGPATLILSPCRYEWVLTMCWVQCWAQREPSLSWYSRKSQGHSTGLQMRLGAERMKLLEGVCVCVCVCVCVLLEEATLNLSTRARWPRRRRKGHQTEGQGSCCH
jgi:hypothetical protein